MKYYVGNVSTVLDIDLFDKWADDDFPTGIVTINDIEFEIHKTKQGSAADNNIGVVAYDYWDDFAEIENGEVYTADDVQLKFDNDKIYVIADGIVYDYTGGSID